MLNSYHSESTVMSRVLQEDLDGIRFAFDRKAYEISVKFPRPEIDMLANPYDSYKSLDVLYMQIKQQFRYTSKKIVRQLVTLYFTLCSGQFAWYKYLTRLIKGEYGEVTASNIEKIFNDKAVPEWIHLAKARARTDDYEPGDSGYKCACKKCNLKHLNYIICKKNGNILLIGSTCINQYYSKALLDNSELSKNTRECDGDLCGMVYPLHSLKAVILEVKDEKNKMVKTTKYLCDICMLKLKDSGSYFRDSVICKYCDKPLDARKKEGDIYHKKCHESFLVLEQERRHKEQQEQREQERQREQEELKKLTELGNRYREEGKRNLILYEEHKEWVEVTRNYADQLRKYWEVKVAENDERIREKREKEEAMKQKKEGEGEGEGKMEKNEK